MNTLATLLGGLLLILILYGALGWIASLPPALRAVLASRLSLVAYFVLMVGRWPGLDVVAMHISISLVAGLLLYMFTQYRSRRAGRMHWAPRLLIGFFVLLAIINTFLLYIATRGLPPTLAQYWLPDGAQVNTGFSGVVEHGQDAAKAVSSELSRSYSAAQLGWQIRFDGLRDTAQAHQLITVKVLDRTGLPVSGLSAEIQLMRLGADHTASKIPLLVKGVGEYSNMLDLPASGRWLVNLQLSQNARVVYRETREVTLP